MRTKNALYNLVASLLLTIATAVAGMILPRMFITTYGSTVNGLISSIKQFLAYLALVEAGIGYASMAMLFSPIKQKNYKHINGILSATKIQYAKSGWLFSILIVLFSLIYPLFVNNQVSYKITFFMFLVLGLSGAAEFFLVGKYRVFLTAAQKGYVIYLIQTLGTCFNLAVNIVLIHFKVDIVIVQLVASIVFIMRFILIKAYINKYYKQISFNEKPNSNALTKRWDVLVHQIVNLVLVNTPIILITVVLGLSEVSVFAIYLLVHNMIIMLLAVFMNGFQAVFGDIISEKNSKILVSSYHLYEFVFFAVVGAVYTVSALLFNDFIKLYTSGFEDALYVRPRLVYFFIIVGILHNLRVPSMAIINSAALFKETKKTAIIEAIIGLVTSLIFIQFWGMEGVLLGWITAYSYRIIVLLKQISIDFVYGSIYPTIKLIVFNLIIGIITYILCYNWIIFKSNNYVDFVLNAVVSVIITILISLFSHFLFYRNEFLLVIGKLGNIFRKNKIHVENFSQ